MGDKQDPSAGTDKLGRDISLLSVGEVKCDKCGKLIRHLDRYCYNSNECPVCGAAVDSLLALDVHLSLQHPTEPPRGTRYCVDCSLKAGYLKMVRDKKTGEVFPAMLVLRDEEEIES